MTPWQLDVILYADADERKYQHELSAWHAWHVAGLGRCKKMPTLKEMMGGNSGKSDVDARLKATLKASFPIKRKV